MLHNKPIKCPARVAWDLVALLSFLELCCPMAPPPPHFIQEGNVSTKMSISVRGLLTDAVSLSADFLDNRFGT